MGGVFSRWRKKASTEEILEDLHVKVVALEESKKTSIEKQKRLIASLILYSVLLYITGALLFYFYYMPESWSDRLLYSSPMAVFPFLVWLVKKFLHWFYVKRITKNDSALEELKEKRKTILEEVMEKETYKRAKEILEKYDPQRFKQLETPEGQTPKPQAPNGQELRQRNPQQRGVPQSAPRMPLAKDASSTPAAPGQGHGQPPGALHDSKNGPGQFVGPAVPRTPRLPRPVLPRDRTVMDRVVEYLVGDGPQNRYALICKQCSSHNGMALREEFEYISFRCCYCFTANPARKQKPFAPKLNFTPLPVRRQMTPPEGKATISESDSEETDAVDARKSGSLDNDLSPDSTSNEQSEAAGESVKKDN